MNKPLRLFHATNAHSLQSMQQHGFMGLDMVNYKELTDAIIARTSMPPGTLDAILKSMANRKFV